MNEIIFWLLIAATGHSYSSPALIAKFKNEKDCELAASQISERARARLSQRNRDIAYLDGICIPVTGLVYP